MVVFQAEDGIRDLVRSRGLGDVYKRQELETVEMRPDDLDPRFTIYALDGGRAAADLAAWACLLYTSDAADERSSVDLGGRRIIKKKKRTRSRVH